MYKGASKGNSIRGYDDEHDWDDFFSSNDSLYELNDMELARRFLRGVILGYEEASDEQASLGARVRAAETLLMFNDLWHLKNQNEYECDDDD